MANINVVAEKPIKDGFKLKFRTPCDSTTIEGLVVKYPVKNGVGSVVKTFVFKDAHGTELSGFGNVFVSGVMIEVLLDVTHSVAYIQNADTNSYVESIKGEVERLENAQKQFLKEAGKIVEECNEIATSAEGFAQAMQEAAERAESVQGVYVGEGDMPEGYSLQIDPNGDSVKVDNAFNMWSTNPIANQVVAAWKADVDATESRTQKAIDELEDRATDLENRANEMVADRNKVLNEYGDWVAPGANRYVLLYAEIQIYDPFGVKLFKLLFSKKNGTANVFISVPHTLPNSNGDVIQVELSFDDDGKMTSAVYLNNSETAMDGVRVTYAPFIVGLC